MPDHHYWLTKLIFVLSLSSLALAAESSESSEASETIVKPLQETEGKNHFSDGRSGSDVRIDQDSVTYLGFFKSSHYIKVLESVSFFLGGKKCPDS
jgi:hypothetical protein